VVAAKEAGFGRSAVESVVIIGANNQIEERLIKKALLG
jgi:hypothetical protein